MWEELERYRNHYLQKEIQDVMKASSINCQQNKGKHVIYSSKTILLYSPIDRDEPVFGQT